MLETGKFYLGHVGRVPVYIAIEALLIIMFVWRNTPPQHFGLVLFLISLCALLVTIFLHELGHATVAVVEGMSGVSITIGAMGGYCSYTGDRRPKRVLPITVAGVAVNFATWGLCQLVLQHVAPAGDGVLRWFVVFLGGWSLGLGIFNSLPIYPLDGGQALLLISQMVARSEGNARRFTLSASVVAAVGVLYFASRYDLPDEWLVIIMVFLLLQAFRDLR